MGVRPLNKKNASCIFHKNKGNFPGRVAAIFHTFVFFIIIYKRVDRASLLDPSFQFEMITKGALLISLFASLLTPLTPLLHSLNS